MPSLAARLLGNAREGYPFKSALRRQHNGTPSFRREKHRPSALRRYVLLFESRELGGLAYVVYEEREGFLHPAAKPQDIGGMNGNDDLLAERRM